MRGSLSNSEVCFPKSIFYIINIFSSRNQWNNKSCLITEGLPLCRYSCKRGNKCQGVKTALVCLVTSWEQKGGINTCVGPAERPRKREKREMRQNYPWWARSTTDIMEITLFTCWKCLTRKYGQIFKEFQWVIDVGFCSNPSWNCFKWFWNSFVMACFYISHLHQQSS